MTNGVLLPRPLRFCADKTMLLTLRWHCAFAQKHLPLPLRFRAKNICWPNSSGRFRTQLCRGMIDKVAFLKFQEKAVIYLLL
ncbi:hypothetical protein [Lysinibacillus xylanilyticus]|uniref:hypothetical protein n=1 Tax=Lysinibacillus xylanilyticus TaxID=582475 RepID=UPI003D04C6E8